MQFFSIAEKQINISHLLEVLSVFEIVDLGLLLEFLDQYRSPQHEPRWLSCCQTLVDGECCHYKAEDA